MADSLLAYDNLPCKWTSGSHIQHTVYRCGPATLRVVAMQDALKSGIPCAGEPKGGRALWPPGRAHEGLGRRRRIGHARKGPRHHSRCVEGRCRAATIDSLND